MSSCGEKGEVLSKGEVKRGITGKKNQKDQ